MAAPRRAAPQRVTQPKAAPKVVAPSGAGREVALPASAPKVVTPRGSRAVRRQSCADYLRAALAAPSFGAETIRHFAADIVSATGGGWRTFVALSTLGAIAIGASEYYPYAYISAPAPYCEGLTEDGCQLMWQDVETIEGDVIPQCVAYCPWK